MRGTTCRRGQATVEFALILPVFLMITGGAIQFGQVFFAYAQLLQSTQEGARYGAVLHHSDAEITTRVQQVSPGGNADTVSITTAASPTNTAAVSAANRAPGNVITVAATHSQGLLIPFFPQNAITLSARTSMVVE